MCVFYEAARSPCSEQWAAIQHVEHERGHCIAISSLACEVGGSQLQAVPCQRQSARACTTSVALRCNLRVGAHVNPVHVC